MAPSALDAHAGCGYEYGSIYYPGDSEWSGNRHREALRAFCQRRDRAPRLAVANIATIAADIAGVAGVLAMFLGARWEFFVPAILLVLIVILYLGYTRVKSILTLLTFVMLRYIVAVLIARPDWGSVVRATLIPQVTASSTWLVAALGLSGTTISPYMLFWQANEDAEELRHGTSIQASQESLIVWIGMIYSNIVSFFIIITAATTIHSGGEQIQGLADAARALSPLGKFGEAAFLVGLVGAGLLALPVLAGSTAYAIAEVFWLARRSGAPSRTSPRLLPGPIAQPGRWCNHLTVARFSSCCSAFL